MYIDKFLYFFFILSTAISCSRIDDVVIELPTAVPRTVMVYMAANNNLVSDAYENLNQMEEGFSKINGKLIVYARILGQKPTLYEIVHDTSPEIKSKVLKTYTNHNSSDPAIMKMVFDDIKNIAPAYSYGVILWSHATNWAPVNVDAFRARSFGDDNNKKMEVQDLKESLPPNLDFLIFDACSMASVEVLYELRDKARYILASPTEVLSIGMPYHKIDALLFHPDVKTGLTEIVKTYVDFYQKKIGLEQSATFSLVDTEKIALLAKEIKQLLINNLALFPKISRVGVQRLDFDPNTPVQAFDFADMLDKHFSLVQLESLKNVLEKAVVYKANTPNFLGNPIRAFSGISTYIPVEEEANLLSFYKTLSWSKDSGFSSVLLHR